MRQKAKAPKAPAEKVVKDIRRATRRQYNAEEKIRIVLEGLRGEDKGNDKGKVEGVVGYARRNFMVPLPRFIRRFAFTAAARRRGDRPSSPSSARILSSACRMTDQ